MNRPEPFANPQALVHELLLNLARRLRSTRQVHSQARKLAERSPAAKEAFVELEGDLTGARLEAWNSLQAAKQICGEHTKRFSHRSRDGEDAPVLDPQTAFEEAVARYELARVEMSSAHKYMCQVMSAALTAKMPVGAVIGRHQDPSTKKPRVPMLTVKGIDGGRGDYQIASAVDVQFDGGMFISLATWTASAHPLDASGKPVISPADGQPAVVKLSSHVVPADAADSERDLQAKLSSIVQEGLALAREQALQRIQEIDASRAAERQR